MKMGVTHHRPSLEVPYVRFSSCETVLTYTYRTKPASSLLKAKKIASSDTFVPRRHNF